LLYFLDRVEINRRLVELRNIYTSTGISEELRGWSWDRPPVQPLSRKYLLGVSELSNRYCSTYRDIYLRRIVCADSELSFSMVTGTVIHIISHEFVIFVKKALYSSILNGKELIDEAGQKRDELLEKVKSKLSERIPSLDNLTIKRCTERCLPFLDFIAVQAGAKLDYALSRYPDSEEDSIVSNMFLPIVERKVDGSLIGLSRQLSIDMISEGQAILELKYGERKEFHKYQLTGYALALESECNIDANYGMIVYDRFDDRRSVPKISLDSYFIGDELRREFLEMRDEALRILSVAKDPGMPSSCPASCAYFTHCNPQRAEEKVDTLETYNK